MPGTTYHGRPKTVSVSPHCHPKRSTKTDIALANENENWRVIYEMLCIEPKKTNGYNSQTLRFEHSPTPLLEDVGS